MRWHNVLIAVLAVFVLLPGCADDGAGGEGAGELPVLVQDGKEDNFLSMTAQEYYVKGETTVRVEESYLDGDEDALMARVHELISYKQVVIGWFLNAYMVEKSSHDDNESYGGFKALTKNGSYEDLNIRQDEEDPATFHFEFQQEIGGQNDLMAAMKLTPDAEGRAQFDLTIGKISNTDMAKLETDREWYRRSPWSSFDPTKVDESKLDSVALTIWPEPRSVDGWFDYARLMEDGELTIGIHYGWDYHNAYHVKHAEAVFEWLQGKGWEAPVETFAELTHESGPFTKQLVVRGEKVDAKIWIFTGIGGSATDPDTNAGGQLLEDLMKESFRDRDVIVFSGHSGPFYGFALANWRKTSRGDIDDSEVKELEMPADRYQVVFAEGCDTYGLGQSFWENPNKADRTNVDVITTTSFSNASTPAAVKDFLTAMTGTDYDGNHEPQKFSELLKDLDGNSYWFSTMYGIHGIDDNPHIHPWADVNALCMPCSSDDECTTTDAPAQGMSCVRLDSSSMSGTCTAECTGDDGCPVGYTCEKVADNYWIKTKSCVPANEKRSCELLSQPEEQPVVPDVMINEVLADPPAGDHLGDANGDGDRHYRKDEFVELLNVGTGPADLGGWSLSDGTRVRIVFPKGTTLPAGEALVVFGGGNPDEFATLGGAMVFVADGGLALGNRGDSVSLADAAGELVDTVSWGKEGGQDVSLVRERDGDKDAGLVPHPVVPHSAGLDADGNEFLELPNIVYMGASLDGYIADRDGGLGFLERVPNPTGDDLGFAEFMGSVDALLMGRKTFETVLSFGGEWPYTKPVFVYSGSLETVPAELEDRVSIVRGDLDRVVGELNAQGYERLYVDGGQLVRTFLARDEIDELIVTRVPILLGGGTPLFGDLPEHLVFEHLHTEVLLGQLVKSTYRRAR